MRWFVLLLLGGCLEYEVEIETVVKEDGSFRRTVAIREKSEKPKTWVRYAPPAAPYVLTGDEKRGFVATMEGEPGTHAGGLRALFEDLSGKYGGAEATKGKRVLEGKVRVRVEDLVFGKLYRYEETLDFGIDPAAFRRELDFALECGLSILISAFELLEPEVDFQPVRAHARRDLLPEVRGSVLLMRQAAIRLIESDRWKAGNMRVDEFKRDPSFVLLLAELRRLGIHHESSAREPRTVNELFEDSKWTITDRMWSRLLEPLGKRTPNWKASLKERWLRAFDSEGESHLLERAYEKAVPEEKREVLERRLEEGGRALFGVLTMHEFFDEHNFTVRVRMPGTLLIAEGAQLHRHPTVEWRRDDFMVANPRFLAWSFVPNELMVGHIRDAHALLRVADCLQIAEPEEREELAAFFRAAGKVGLSAALEEVDRDNEPWSLLNKALEEK
jgi:hypothetical protein